MCILFLHVVELLHWLLICKLHLQQSCKFSKYHQFPIIVRYDTNVNLAKKNSKIGRGSKLAFLAYFSQFLRVNFAKPKSKLITDIISTYLYIVNEFCRV